MTITWNYSPHFSVGCVVIAIYTYILITAFPHYPFCILSALSKHLSLPWFFTWWDDPNLHS